jgi:hypothetical protein
MVKFAVRLINSDLIFEDVTGKQGELLAGGCGGGGDSDNQDGGDKYSVSSILCNFTSTTLRNNLGYLLNHGAYSPVQAL